MNQRFIPFAIAAAVFLLDRITKSIIKAHFSAWDTLSVIPNFFNIVHTENPGIAFGMLTNAPGWWRDALLIGFSIAVLIGISIMLLKSGTSGLRWRIRKSLRPHHERNRDGFFGVSRQPIVLFPGIQCSRQRHLLRCMPVADGHVAVAGKEEPARAGFLKCFRS